MRRLLVLAAVAIVASAAVLPASVLALTPAIGADGDVIGRTSGAIECKSYQYERSDGSKGSTPMMPCDELSWSYDVVDGPPGTVADLRDFTGRARNGISYAQTVDQSARFARTFDAQGDLAGIEVEAELTTTISHAGDTKTTLLLEIPFETTATNVRLDDTFVVSVTGTDNYAGRAQGDISVDCIGAPAEGLVNEHHRLLIRGRDVQRRNEGDNTFGGSIPTGSGQCTLRVKVEIAARNSDTIKADHSAAVELHLQLALTVPPCDLAGFVRDGVPEHETDPFHVMTGIPVELLDDGQRVVHRAVSDDRGRYCFRDVTPAAYRIRATLEDGAHDPPIFRTIHHPKPDDVVTEKPVEEADFSRQDFDVDFADTADFPLRSDVAAVHREATRFVNWLLAAGIITVAEIETFTINTDVPDADGTAYTDGLRLVDIQESDTRYVQRSGPGTECPENCEWHEIGHHVGYRLGIPVEASPACDGRVNHGGWRNSTSCDSIVEGFPTFLATLGSLSIDGERGGGYATPAYSYRWNLEDNGFMPWTMYEPEDGGVLGREDFAFSQLLWDLVDSTPAEVEVIAVQAASGLRLARIPDTLELDASTLVRFLAGARLTTVADIRAALTLSDLVGDAETNRTVELDGDDVPDVSALEAAFLAHGFHAVPDTVAGIYHMGDPIGSTRRQAVDANTGVPLPGELILDRSKMLPAAGSAIQLENPTTSNVTFTVDITYPSTASHWDVVVPANGTALLGLELPPYSRSLPPDGELPACGAADHRLVTVSVSALGVAPLTFDNCAFAHALASATGEFAMTYGASPTSSGGPGDSALPGASPAPVESGGAGQMPMMFLTVVVIAVAVVAVGGLAIRRRGRAA